MHNLYRFDQDWNVFNLNLLTKGKSLLSHVWYRAGGIYKREIAWDSRPIHVEEDNEME